MLPVSSFFIIKIKPADGCDVLSRWSNVFYLDSQIPFTGSALYSVINFIYLLFLCLPERKRNKKKGQPITWPIFDGLSCAV